VLEKMHHEEKLSVETSFKRKDGSVFMAQATPCKYILGDKPLIHVFIQDITERKRMLKKLREFNKELEFEVEKRTNELKSKNKELEEFAYIASHDLQEPLRTISSFSQLLERQYKDRIDEKADRYLRYISEASTRMRDLVKSLLDYSRLGKDKKREKVDCNLMLQEVQKDISALIAKTHTTIIQDDLPVIESYALEFRLLFQNLISNGIKFRKKDVSPKIEISVSNEDGWTFAVRDNGIGIPEEHQEKIFSIFQRLHPRKLFEGSGIGLAHCQKIVNLHGGKIWVESIPKKGSTFYFNIPDQSLKKNHLVKKITSHQNF